MLLRNQISSAIEYTSPEQQLTFSIPAAQALYEHSEPYPCCCYVQPMFGVPPIRGRFTQESFWMSGNLHLLFTEGKTNKNLKAMMLHSRVLTYLSYFINTLEAMFLKVLSYI